MFVEIELLISKRLVAQVAFCVVLLIQKKNVIVILNTIFACPFSTSIIHKINMVRQLFY